MPLEPIPNWKPICNHLEHNPPMYIYVPPGMQYRHRCPACGVESIIMCPEITCGVPVISPIWHDATEGWAQCK